MNRDENPILGPARRPPRHVARFFEWSEARGLLSISRAIDSVTRSDTKPLLLTGALTFLASVEVGDVLCHWAESSNNTFVKNLYPLAQALATSFPEPRRKSTDQPIRELLRENLESGYLGAMLATRQAPDLPEPQLDALTCLRLWILVFTIQYCVRLNSSSPSLKISKASRWRVTLFPVVSSRMLAMSGRSGRPACSLIKSRCIL